MVEKQDCDICGRSGAELSAEWDGDGLWVCCSCRDKLTDFGATAEINEDPELRHLAGKSAGSICHTLNLPYEPPYQLVIDAASRIGYDEDRFMSAWPFVRQWIDGTTLWRSETGDKLAIVTVDGDVHIQAGY